MEKIAYIVPSETMIPAVEEILADDVKRGVVVVQTVDVYRSAAEYRRLAVDGYGVIIARGGIYTDLAAVSDSVHVMEEKIRTSDILYMLTSVRETYRGKIDVVLREHVAKKFEGAVSLFDFPLEVRRYTDLESLKRQLESIPEQGVVVLSSGVASMLCDREDLTMVELMNRDTTIRETVRVAKEFLTQLAESAKRVNVLESILNNVDEGLIIFDREYRIREVNSKAEELLAQSAENLLAADVRKVIPNMPAKRMPGVCETAPRSFVRKLDRAMLSFTIHPFQFYKSEKRYLTTVQDVTKIQELEHTIRMKLAQKGLVASYHFDDIKTEDAAMKALIKRAKTIAGFEGSVLIYGENGTGKELFAQSIHNASRRRERPFVAVNCAALSESLLESELFGYVAGAFTGARSEGKAGLFELAHQGTIFLDEINSMPMGLQAKILRVIEQQEVMRVGSDYVIPLDVRIIAASNGNLTRSIRENQFRKDLFFRLNTFQLNIPPVKERKGDIVPLFKYYLAELRGCRAEDILLSPSFEEELLAHHWLGNVREIKSAALRYHAFDGDNSCGEIIQNGQADEGLVDEELKIDLGQLNKVVETMVIESLLAKGTSKNDVAKALGISRQALYKKLHREE